MPPTTVDVTWQPNDTNLVLLFYGPDNPGVVTLPDPQTGALTAHYFSQTTTEVGFQVKSKDLSKNYIRSDSSVLGNTTTETFNINSTQNVATFVVSKGPPTLTGMRFRLFMGVDEKPDDMAIQIFIAPSSNKDNYFAGYQQVRGFFTGVPNDLMNQPMVPFSANAPTTVDMKMLRPVTPDDLNAIVRFWVDPQSGGWLSRPSHITFSWALVPQWNNVWVDDKHLTNTGVVWTLGREPGQPSYVEQSLYIDPNNR